ncbi:MAG TPA: IS481 family transposase [Pyrinomonadaceae bacterium]|nr:IS481 family transposase [Pyrinomonadaceae bacterium]
MPWKTEKVVEQRLRFLIDMQEPGMRVSELCRRYQVSRKTAYKWLSRYRGEGSITALEDRSRRPHRSPRRTNAEREARVLAIRDEKGWGANKISYVVAKEGLRIPAITVHRILKRNDRIRRLRVDRIAQKRFARAHCNELAQMDFKGEYELANGGKCYPLTLMDDCSRYLLGLWPLPNTKASGVQEVLRTHFRKVGLPREMLMDHGSSWYCNHNGHGLTWLSIWLIKQGITLRYSGFRHPQTQGKVERLHGTLQRRTQHRGVPTTMRTWCAWADEFRREYNFERPHEALGMKTPGEIYRHDNLRPYREQPPAWEYGGGEVRRLDNQGGLNKFGRWFFVCEALAKEWVRVDQLDHKLVVTFRHLTVREINLQTGSSTAVLLPSEVE